MTTFYYFHHISRTTFWQFHHILRTYPHYQHKIHARRRRIYLGRAVGGIMKG